MLSTENNISICSKYINSIDEKGEDNNYELVSNFFNSFEPDENSIINIINGDGDDDNSNKNEKSNNQHNDENEEENDDFEIYDKDEIIYKPESFGKLSMVSKRFYSISNDPSVWKYVIRKWQNKTISKLKKKIYSKKPSLLVNRILVPPIVLDEQGDVVTGPLPAYDASIAHALTHLNATTETASTINEFIALQLNNAEDSDFEDGDNSNIKLRNFKNNQLKQKQINNNNNNNNDNKNNSNRGCGSNNNNNNNNNNKNKNNSSNSTNNGCSSSNNGNKVECDGCDPDNIKTLKSKDYYIKSYIKIKDELSNRMTIVKVQEQHQKKIKNISISSKLMFYTLFSRPSEWFSVLFLILFTLLIGLKLDNYLNWSWPIVFLPLMLLTFQFFVTPLIFVIFKVMFNHSYEEELAPDSFIKPLFFSLFFILPLQPNETISKVLLFTPILCMISFVVLLVSKLMMEYISWVYVFIPIFMFCIYFMILTVGFPERIDSELEFLDQGTLIFSSMFFSFFILLLFLKVGEAVNYDWYLIFSPMFLIKLMALIYPIIIRITSVSKYSDWLEGKSKWFRESGSLSLVISFFFLVSCPFFVFEIMLIQNLNFPNDAYKYSIIADS
ncbi:hypothetical protein DDB_G0282139 [Dictyostelium discoideum AX4]|uniref:F-box domain-containing protein n=1 Tax=Dictyostelium discoideum TaxID=44689 RepID=Q54SY4_DICDI|nr:hypothetical protein DDB_G0282139 [Dictyostelium discoideum AX4]EAL66395.1 hypothetical protein DDB_G0282139 [Dictyostelium discoideum AX4]|eukprot:XP_640371.1 hypothetical protein DDB_G0282139 [Dictyostelium discoideum AX4]